MQQEFSAGGLVSKDGKLLLVQVNNLKGERVWTFPKGHLEKGETSLQAALREVEEETGWRCRFIKPLLNVDYRFQRQGVPVAKTVEWYLMEPLAKVGKPDAIEVLSCRWMTIAEAQGVIQYPSDIQLLETFRSQKS